MSERPTIEQALRAAQANLPDDMHLVLCVRRGAVALKVIPILGHDPQRSKYGWPVFDVDKLPETIAELVARAVAEPAAGEGA